MADYGVGVLCTTYNQVGYISQCLDSLISQETNFRYKVIVHDDASTDGTTEIVRTFAAKYPDKVVAIIQEDNLYSRGVSRNSHVDPHLSDCKYIALCEGDDWWISKQKLQRQFDYMEAHPSCTLCTHNVMLFDDSCKLPTGSTPGKSTDFDCDVSDVIENGGAFFGTNSMFYRTRDRKMPKQFTGWGVGDYPTAIWLTSLGYAHCLYETMSAYRINAKGSWTSTNKNSFEKANNATLKIIQGLRKLNEYYGLKYGKSIDIAINRQLDNLIWAKLDYSLRKQKSFSCLVTADEWRAFLKRQSFVDKCKAIAKKKFPWLCLAYLRRRKIHNRSE